MSNEETIDTKPKLSALNVKINKNIGELLKNSCLQTVSVIETKSGIEKYDRGIYYFIGCTDKKTKKKVWKLKKKEGAKPKDPKELVEETITRKQIVNMNTKLKHLLSSVFVDYVHEFSLLVDKAIAEEYSLKNEDQVITSLLEMLSDAQTEDGSPYRYLPFIVTLYRDNVHNNEDDTVLKSLSTYIENHLPSFTDEVNKTYELIKTNQHARRVLLYSYMYMIAIFAMGEVTRVWIESNDPNEEVEEKKEADKTDEDKVTKLISSKTIGVPAFKTFMLSKMQSCFDCSKLDYLHVIKEVDVKVEEIEVEIKTLRDQKAKENAKKKEDTKARNEANLASSASETARDDDEDDGAVGPDDEEPADDKPAEKKPEPKKKLGGRGGRAASKK